MSLRARILVAIVLVNLAVTAVMVVLFRTEIEKKDRVRREQRDEAFRTITQDLLSMFGQTFGSTSPLVLDVSPRARVGPWPRLPWPSCTSGCRATRSRPTRTPAGSTTAC